MRRRCHFDFTTIPHRVPFNTFLASLRLDFGWTSIPPSASLRFHIGLTSMFTSISSFFNFNINLFYFSLTPISQETRKTPCRERREHSVDQKGTRRRNRTHPRARTNETTRFPGCTHPLACNFLVHVGLWICRAPKLTRGLQEANKTRLSGHGVPIP